MAFLLLYKSMALKKNMKHPSFLIGAISFVLFLIGIVMKANSYASGDMVILSSIILGAIHWIWSVVNVVTGYDLNPDSKSFWLILVMLIPPIGVSGKIILHE